jgi:hypothetical protein
MAPLKMEIWEAAEETSPLERGPATANSKYHYFSLHYTCLVPAWLG